MRSSNKRSRSKGNRNRPSGGNIVNRVFDSSGPEGKVRGTPQQIIDKYNQLTRDAQLSNDRVAAENFAQHAEHYTRMLAEAQREIDQRREQADQQNRERQQQASQAAEGASGAQGEAGSAQGGEPNRQDDRNRPVEGADGRQDDRARGEEGRSQERHGDQGEAAAAAQSDETGGTAAPAGGEAAEKPRRRARKPREDKSQQDGNGDVIDTGGPADSGLVETPENKPKRRGRKPKAENSASDDEGNGGGGDGGGETQAAE